MILKGFFQLSLFFDSVNKRESQKFESPLLDLLQVSCIILVGHYVFDVLFFYVDLVLCFPIWSSIGQFTLHACVELCSL